MSIREENLTVIIDKCVRRAADDNGGRNSKLYPQATHRRNNANTMKFVQRALPFHIPIELRAVLMSLRLEYGTGGGVGDVLPATAVWAIVNESDDCTAFVWLRAQDGADGIENHLSIAVLPEHRGCGAGHFAMDEVEKYLATKGVDVLHAQVNSNKKETGLWVRQWLMRRGFVLVRGSAIRAPHSSLNDGDLAIQYAGPLDFRKIIV